MYMLGALGSGTVPGICREPLWIAGLSSLPVPEGQPGPRQTGGVPPAVIKAGYVSCGVLLA